MKIQIITLFPEMFDKVLNSSMLWKAQERAAVEFALIDLRHGRHLDLLRRIDFQVQRVVATEPKIICQLLREVDAQQAL